jgi:anti-sigma factor RsiW
MIAPAPNSDNSLLVHGYLDGELDPAHALEIERAIAADPALAAERDSTLALSNLIRDRLAGEHAPGGLQSRIESTVGLRRERARPTWGMLAAASVLVAALASGTTWLATNWLTLRPSPRTDVAELIVADHLRALMAPQPTDVSSTDRHTVKPWFNGRVPQAPKVVDLTREGFPLIGGRVDVIDRMPVPTLVYRHNQHLISLTAVPETSARAPTRHTVAGFNVLEWSDNGMRYWAVSDVAAADLDSFEKAFRAAEPDG